MQTASPVGARRAILFIVAGLLGFLIFGGLTSLTLEAPRAAGLHTVLEVSSIAFGCVVFFIAWYSTGPVRISVAVVSLVVLGSGILTLVHLIAFPEMHAVMDVKHIWITAWLFSRFVWSFGLLAAVTLLDRNGPSCQLSSRSSLLFGAMVAVGGLVADIFIAPDSWPYLYSIDSPAHPLAIYGLYVSCAANVATFIILLGRRINHVGILPHTAVLLGALADLSFAFAGHSPENLNIAAHLFAALANLYVLRTLYVILIRQPFADAMAMKEDMEKLAENNARLFRESEEQRNLFEDILANVGMIISSQLNLRETLDAIADMVADMMRARQCVIALFNEDRSVLKVAATYGMNTPPDLLPLKDSVAAQVCETQTALTVDDLLIQPELFRPQLVFTSIRSVIAAPLVNDREIIGVVEAYSSEKGAFSQRDVLLLKALGYHAGAAVAGATLHEQTKARLDEEQYLYRIAQASATTVDPDTILEQCLPCAAQALGAEFALAFFAGGQADEPLIFKAAVGLSFRPADIDLGFYPELRTLVATMIPSMLPSGDAPPLKGLCGDGATGPVMVMPLPVNSRLLGLMLLGWRRRVSPENIECTPFATLMAQQIALALEKASLYNQVKAMALSDGLTGLANRRNFDLFLDAELRRAFTLRRPLSLIMLDLDNFKKYNDTYGHPTGDKLLAQLGDILRQNTRTIDFPARYGGEEFSVILPECGATEATSLAEKIRRTVEAGEFPDNAGTFTARITASMGVATYDPSVNAAPPDPASFIAVADSALYQAKQGGRNRVVSTPLV
ncbi:diguanylate cyclase [Anaeroselena agilis]|uniref:Diguanylate cyclase n=1 Tax=Anaeroselena agilis TaxID=3063788 RepID=A0ABU3NVS5_9FIRM|nr:diguanylate cyclase [Selenomonadales bacterium 4137-cl]